MRTKDNNRERSGGASQEEKDSDAAYLAGFLILQVFHPMKYIALLKMQKKSDSLYRGKLQPDFSPRKTRREYGEKTV